MTKVEIIHCVTQAGLALSAIPAGRVDSVAGAIAFQRDIVTYRRLFAEFTYAIQDDDKLTVMSCLQGMRKLAHLAPEV